MPAPTLFVDRGNLELRWGDVTALCPGPVRLGHLGCGLLSKVRTELPPELAAQWEQEFGPRWRDTKDVSARVAQALRQALSAADLPGASLWDTMRRGSDFWRPGRLLLDIADALRDAEPPVEISYAREDALCPSLTLLTEFRFSEMPFGEYGQRYADELHSHGGAALRLAVACLVLDLVRSRLPVLYCVDPYVPGYCPHDEFMSGAPYAQRHWLPGLREAGCHRFILAEEIIRFLLALGVPVSLYEIDATFETFHLREYGSLRVPA